MSARTVTYELEARLASNAGNAEIARIPVQKGRGRHDKESLDPNAFPKLEAGRVIEVRVNGMLVLSGMLRTD